MQCGTRWAKSVFRVIITVLATGMTYSQAKAEAWPAGVLCARTTNSSETLIMPLKSTDVHLRLIAGILSSTVTQTFLNDTATPLEAVYLFPLPAGAAVTDMEMRIGDRRIRSVVKEKEEAKVVYEQARKEGQAAALVEADRPNLFRTSVANFMPGDEVAVTLTYTETAILRDGVYSVVFPMVIGQRYFPTPTNTPAFCDRRTNTTVTPGALNPPVLPAATDPVNRVAITLETYGIPIAHITCRSHLVDIAPIEDIPESYSVTLTDGPAVANCDFAVDVAPPTNCNPVVSWVVSREDNALHGLLTIFPPVAPSGSPSQPRDIVFLVDTSGSMEGESITQAVCGIEACLKQLNPDDRFNIVRFASDHSSFSPELLSADSATLARATDFVRSMTADGGTEMQPALKHSLTMLAGSSRLPIVVFLTDGCVGNETDLMRLLHDELAHTRLFTFGIGSAPNDYVMTKIAALGRGQARFIRSAGDVGEVISCFFQTLASPVLTDVKVQWLDAIENPSMQYTAYPALCPDVFVDRPLQLIAEFRELPPAIAIVSGYLNGQRQVYRFNLDPQPFTHAMVGRLFGKAQVDDLMTRTILTKSTAEADAIKADVIAAALRYQLVTPYTSRIAIEERVVRGPDGALLTIPVATPPPRGWNMFESTATQDLLWLAIGIAVLLGGAACLYPGKLRR